MIRICSQGVLCRCSFCNDAANSRFSSGPHEQSSTAGGTPRDAENEQLIRDFIEGAAQAIREKMRQREERRRTASTTTAANREDGGGGGGEEVEMAAVAGDGPEAAGGVAVAAEAEEAGGGGGDAAPAAGMTGTDIEANLTPAHLLFPLQLRRRTTPRPATPPPFRPS